MNCRGDQVSYVKIMLGDNAARFDDADETVKVRLQDDERVMSGRFERMFSAVLLLYGPRQESKFELECLITAGG
jgi:hypothetical protein